MNATNTINYKYVLTLNDGDEWCDQLFCKTIPIVYVDVQSNRLAASTTNIFLRRVQNHANPRDTKIIGSFKKPFLYM